MIDITLRPNSSGEPATKELRFVSGAPTPFQHMSSPPAKIIARELVNGQWLVIEFPISIADFNPDSVRNALELILK